MWIEKWGGMGGGLACGLLLVTNDLFDIGVCIQCICHTLYVQVSSNNIVNSLKLFNLGKICTSLCVFRPPHPSSRSGVTDFPVLLGCDAVWLGHDTLLMGHLSPLSWRQLSGHVFRSRNAFFTIFRPVRRWPVLFPKRRQQIIQWHVFLSQKNRNLVSVLYYFCLKYKI